MQSVLLAIHLMVVLALIVLVLLQRSEGGGLGMGSASNFMSARGTANTLSRATAILAGVFFVTSLLLAYLAGTSRPQKTILDQAPATNSQPATPAPPSGGGILDSLRQQSPATAP